MGRLDLAQNLAAKLTEVQFQEIMKQLSSTYEGVERLEFLLKTSVDRDAIAR